MDWTYNTYIYTVDIIYIYIWYVSIDPRFNIYRCGLVKNCFFCWMIFRCRCCELTVCIYRQSNLATLNICKPYLGYIRWQLRKALTCGTLHKCPTPKALKYLERLRATREDGHFPRVPRHFPAFGGREPGRFEGNWVVLDKQIRLTNHDQPQLA